MSSDDGEKIPPRTPLPPRPAGEAKQRPPLPEWRKCSFDHSKSEDRSTWARHDFVVEVNGKEVKGRMCGEHGPAAIKRDQDKMISLGADTPETRQLAQDIKNRDPNRLASDPERIESRVIKDPPGWELGLETPVAAAPERSIPGYEGRTLS